MNLGLLIALLALGIGFIAILKVPRKLFTQVADPALEARVEGLEQQIADLRQGLVETQERVDFTERALTRAEEARRLVKGD
jgi:hypothetical protein